VRRALQSFQGWPRETPLILVYYWSALALFLRIPYNAPLIPSRPKKFASVFVHRPRPASPAQPTARDCSAVEKKRQKSLIPTSSQVPSGHRHQQPRGQDLCHATRPTTLQSRHTAHKTLQSREPHSKAANMPAAAAAAATAANDARVRSASHSALSPARTLPKLIHRVIGR
jgi:hypothetical protein